MGAKHSKPRLRRNRRCSSIRKRQAPEGSNDPVPPPNEVYIPGNTNKPHRADDNCKFCGVQDSFHGYSLKNRQSNKTCDNDVEKVNVHPEKIALYNTGYTTQEDLTVNLPRPGKIDCCGRWENKETSRTLPVKSALPGPNRSPLEKDAEQEWTITLYEIDKTSNQVPQEDMQALMSSIYEAVNEKADESPQCRKTVRVRLSVTPERTTHSRLPVSSSPNYSEQTGCHCANCTKTTEPLARESFYESKIKLRRYDTSSPVRNSSAPLSRHTRHDSHRNPRDYFLENNEKLKHTSLHKTDCNTPICNKLSRGLPSRNMLDRTKSLPQTRHRPAVTKTDSQRHAHNKSTRQKRNIHVNDSVNASNRGRRKEPKFASPYDQHFQEAMYLRLRELQRQGAFERRRAVGAQDSDDADDDSDFNDNINKRIKQEESPASHIHETNESSSNDESMKPSNNNTERNCCPVAVETVHHHHYIYHNNSHERPETPNKLAVDCIEKAVKSIQSEIDERDNPSGQSHHIHYHHYHLADTS